MADPFHSSRYSVEHAKRHVREVQAEIRAFFATNPYARVIEPNEDGTKDIHKVKLVKPMPIALAGITFDAIVNLRSALDQAGHAVGLLAGTNGKDAKFPFGDSESEVLGRRVDKNGLIKGTAKNIPKEVFDLMVAFKPYKGGNDLLWAVNKIANANKHEIIIPVAVATGSTHIRHMRIDGGGDFIWPPRWDPVKLELVINTVPRGTKAEINVALQTFIAFGDVHGVRRKPVVPVLNAMASEVERVCMAIEAEARRLKLFS